MARKHWHALRGYPEFNSHSFIDSYLCHITYSSGLRQIILKKNMIIYHQEHSRSESSSRPLTDYNRYREHKKIMIETHKPMIFNNEEWGLSQYRLLEDLI